MRHAVATTVTPYASWQSVVRRGDTVVLRTRRGGVLALPAELVLPAPRAASGPGRCCGRRDTIGPVGRAARLPYAYECTRSTRSRLAWAATTRQLLTPSMIAIGAVDLLLLVSPLVLHGMPWFWAVLPIGLTLVGVAVAWWSAWRREGVCAMPGMVISAGLRDDAMVLEDSTGRVTISYRGVDRMYVMRHAVLIRSQLRSSVLFPRAVLPDAEASAAPRARWPGTGAADGSPRNDTAHRRSPEPRVCRAPGSPLRAGRHPGPGRPCRRKHLCGGGSTC